MIALQMDFPPTTHYFYYTILFYNILLHYTVLLHRSPFICLFWHEMPLTINDVVEEFLKVVNKFKLYACICKNSVLLQ